MTSHTCSLCGKLGWQCVQTTNLVAQCGPVPDWMYLGARDPVIAWQQAVKRVFAVLRALIRDQGIPKIPQKINRFPIRRTQGKRYAEIKAENRVEDIAAQLTELRASSNGMKGRCPFHLERTASFYVWYESQQWRCFGACAEGGDVIDLMRKARIL